MVPLAIQEQEVNAHPDENMLDVAGELLIFIHSRKKSISYHKPFENKMKSIMDRFSNNNVVIIYPEQ